MALQSRLFRGDTKLDSAAVSDPAHIFQGAAGPHVGKIQQALIQLDGANIALDSVYGPATAAAVSTFKQKRQILNAQGKIDNIVGKKTIAALDGEMVAIEKGGGRVGSSSAGTRRGIVGTGAITHTLIYFSGQSRDATRQGVELVKDDPALGDMREDTQEAMEGIEVSPAQTVVRGFGGSNSFILGGAGVGRAAAVIATRDPRGKLIIYGFSAGGINALQLCRALQLGGLLELGQQQGIKVDLLVTVDVSNGSPDSLDVDPVVPGNVTLNRNYFQKTNFVTHSINGTGPRGIRTFGSNAVQIDCTRRKFSVLPPPLGKFNHGQMETVVRFEVIRDMRNVLEAIV